MSTFRAVHSCGTAGLSMATACCCFGQNRIVQAIGQAFLKLQCIFRLQYVANRGHGLGPIASQSFESREEVHGQQVEFTDKGQGP